MAKQPAKRPAAAPPKKAAEPKAPPVFSEIKWLEKVGRRPSLFYAGAAVLMLAVLFRNFLFGPFLFLFNDSGSDTLNAFYPALRHVADYLRDTGTPGWSFSQGIGQDIYPFALTDPFNFPLYWAGGERLVEWLPWVECFKLFLGGLFFQKYLRLMGLGGLPSAMGGLFFAFSGFAVVGSTWYVFSSNVVHAAFLLLAFELFFQKKTWWPFPLAVGLVAAFSPFFSYIYLSFLAVYFLWRQFGPSLTADGGRQTADGLSTADGPDWTGFFKNSGSLIALALLGYALTLVAWLPSFNEMLNSPRMGVASKAAMLRSFPLFGFEGEMHNATAALRTFSNDLAGNGRKFTGWRNYLESPMNYCGLLCLLLLPQVFVGASRRAKWWLGGLVALVVLPQIFPHWRYAFWLFSGDYYRNLSHLFGIVVQLFALAAFSKLVFEKKLNLPMLGATLAFLLGLLYFPWEVKSSPGLKLMVAAFLVIEAGLVFLATRPAGRGFALVALPVLVVIELVLMADPALNDRAAVSKREWATGFYNDGSLAAVRWVQAHDSSFYRITKRIHSGARTSSSMNDAKAQGFFGNESYHSFNHPGLIRLHTETGMIDSVFYKNPHQFENRTRWADGIERFYFVQYLTNSKYYLEADTVRPNPFFRQMTDSLTTVGHVRVYRQKAAAPIGIAYEKYISEEEIAKLAPGLQRQVAMMRACAVASADVPKLAGLAALPLDSVPKTSAYYTNTMLADAAALRRDSMRIDHFSQNRIAGSIDLKEKRLLNISVPLDPGWSVAVDGQPARPLRTNYAFIGLPLEAGSHRIELSYKTPMLAGAVRVSAAALVLYLLILVGGLFLRKKGTPPEPV